MQWQYNIIVMSIFMLLLRKHKAYGVNTNV